MARLFASGRAADLIIGLMLVELAVLTLVHRSTGRGVPPLELAASLGAGGALVLALRAALVGSSWPHPAMWLILALIAHVLYVTVRSSVSRLS